MNAKLQAGIASLRKFLARPDVARWLPNRKVVAGAVAGVLVAGAREVGIADSLPVGWSEAAAFALVSYWLPEHDPADDFAGSGHVFPIYPPDPVTGLDHRYDEKPVPPFKDTALPFEPTEEIDNSELRSRDDGPGIV